MRLPTDSNPFIAILSRERLELEDSLLNLARQTVYSTIILLIATSIVLISLIMMHDISPSSLIGIGLLETVVLSSWIIDMINHNMPVLNESSKDTFLIDEELSSEEIYNLNNERIFNTILSIRLYSARAKERIKAIRFYYITIIALKVCELIMLLIDQGS